MNGFAGSSVSGNCQGVRKRFFGFPALLKCSFEEPRDDIESKDVEIHQSWPCQRIEGPALEIKGAQK